MLPFVFEDGMGFERWVEYALDVPMYFVYRDGTYIDALGQSFRDFLDGRLPALPGELPTLSDWADHLTTLFPEARVKRFIEMRGADGGPWRRICALPALWVGLLYDGTSLDAASDLCTGWAPEFHGGASRFRIGRRDQTHGSGTSSCATLRRRFLLSARRDSRHVRCPGALGLIADETHFLNALHDVVDSGCHPG